MIWPIRVADTHLFLTFSTSPCPPPSPSYASISFFKSHPLSPSLPRAGAWRIGWRLNCSSLLSNMDWRWHFPGTALHPCGCIFPLSQEIMEAVTHRKLEAIGWGCRDPRSCSKGERHISLSQSPLHILVSGTSELTRTDISRVVQLGCTHQVSHPKQDDKSCTVSGGRTKWQGQGERRKQGKRQPSGQVSSFQPLLVPQFLLP